MVTADDLEAALASVSATLEQAIDQDWTVKAGGLEWDCWHTAEHIGDGLMSYGAQLVAQPAGRYVRFLASAEKDASAAEILEFAQAGGGILVATVRTAAPQVRAYHPSGMADPEGFAAMGCVEELLHGQDIAGGLHRSLDPPREVCARVLTRLFRQLPADLAGTDPWLTLQWATGRISLPSHPRLTKWTWQGAPLGE
jgi:hypothetical protein